MRCFPLKTALTMSMALLPAVLAASPAPPSPRWQAVQQHGDVPSALFDAAISYSLVHGDHDTLYNFQYSHDPVLEGWFDGPEWKARALPAEAGPTPGITPTGIGGLEALRLFDTVLAPACISVDHPRFLSFVPAAPSVIGDVISSHGWTPTPSAASSARARGLTTGCRR